jgi:polar amino acid transport system substrate-binding protein
MGARCPRIGQRARFITTHGVVRASKFAFVLRRPKAHAHVPRHRIGESYVMKRQGLRAAVGALGLMLGAAIAQADALDDIKKAGVVKVAVPQDFAPFGSAGPDLKPIGYDIDMANLIARELGVKAEIIAVTSANRIPYLETKKADLVISSLGKNPDREKVIDFSNAYAPFFSGVFGTKEAAITKADDLKGKTVGATRGAIEEQELSKLAPEAIIKRYEDNNATIAAFISGQVDLIATGNVVAAAIAEKNPARAPVSKFVIKNSPCYIGLRKDEPALLAKVNEIIAKAKASGELGKISEKWLKASLPADI